ncbi:serine/threonine-protein kinase [Geodermatophilus sp. SYSU D00696]
MALSTGTILAGRYEITEPIATGGMGEVWRARDRVLDRVVAAKVLRSEFTGDPSFVARFRNEARHTAALSHPNIASVYDYGESTDERGHQLAFLVMELVEGKPLVTILHEEGRLPVDWTLHVLGQSADGLSAAHAAGVVHRDIKPGNLIVRPDGVVKLTDFGIARTRDATPLTRTGMVVGTAQYLSPEQAQGMEVTAASDVYSLGVVGYECLTGGRPFDGTSQVAIALAHINRTPPPLPAEIPPQVRLLIERALAKDPRDRFADGAAFAAAIRSVAGGNGLGPATAATGAPSTGLAAATTEVIPEVDGDGTRVLGGPVAGAAAGAAAVAGPRTGGRHAAGARTMPPLQGPPVDDDDDRGRVAADAPRGGNRRWAVVLASLALVAALVAGAWFLLSGNGEGEGGTTADPTATSSAPTGGSADPTQDLVTIPAAAQYLGEDADDVEAVLREAGLDVARVDATDEDLAAAGIELSAGDVAAVDPAGIPVPRGTTVTLSVAQQDYSPEVAEEPEDSGSGDDQGGEDTGDQGGDGTGGQGNGGGGGGQTQSSGPTRSSTSSSASSSSSSAPSTTTPSSPPATQGGTTAPPPTADPTTGDDGTTDGTGTDPDTGGGTGAGAGAGAGSWTPGPASAGAAGAGGTQ